jgi:hypothetical protein
VSPDDVLEGKAFTVNKKKIKPKADLELLLRSFKATGDLRRLAAAEIPSSRRIYRLEVAGLFHVEQSQRQTSVLAS